MGPTRARVSDTNQHLKVFRPERRRVWDPTRRRATKDRNKDINSDWVNHNACSLSYYIYVVPNLYTSKTDFIKLRAEIIASIFFFWIYILSQRYHRIQIPIGLVAEEICPTLNFEN